MRRFFSKKKEHKAFSTPGHRLNETTPRKEFQDFNKDLLTTGRRSSDNPKTPENRYMSQVKQSTSGRSSTEATSEVVFKCPQLGEKTSLTRSQWAEKIRQHVGKIKTKDPVISSVIAIKSLNPPSEAERCVELLLVYLKNLVEYPENEKYRSIRMGNPTFSERVQSVEGGLDFLKAAGFEEVPEHGNAKEPHLVYNPDSRIDLTGLMKTLVDVKGVELVLDRDFRFYKSKDLKKSLSSRISNDFFKPTPQEIKKEQLERTRELEESKLLKTRQMRENELAKRGRRIPLYTRIRVRLPNEMVIQGTFAVHEKFRELKNLIEEKLEINPSYTLKFPPMKVFEKSDENKTFAELDLQPAVNLVLLTDSKVSLKIMPMSSRNS